MRKDKTYLIRKYALLLVCLYVLVAIANTVLSEFVSDYESSSDIHIRTLIYSGSFYFLNIVVAVVVYNDIKTHRIQAKYSVLCTVVFAALGVCVFLLYVILAELEKNEDVAQHASLPDQQ